MGRRPAMAVATESESAPVAPPTALVVRVEDPAVKKALKQFQDCMNTEFGEGTVQRLSSSSSLSKIDHWASTRSIVVDKVLAGGRPMPCTLLPFGRQTEIHGLPGSGKTTLCAQISAEVQSKGGMVVAIDTEERIDHPYWSQLGVDVDRVQSLTANSIEEVFKKQYKLLLWHISECPTLPLLMLWDSLGGTTTDAIATAIEEGEDPMEVAKKSMMMNARAIAAGMRLINPLIAKSRVAYVYTNTMYMKPNVKYGDPFETPGGWVAKYFATVRLRLKRVGQLLEEDPVTGQRKIYGHRIEVSTEKNSMAPNLIGLEGAILGGLGFSNDWTVREIAEALKIIKKAGAWSTWVTTSGEEVKFQGFNGFVEKVKPHPEYQQLVDAVMAVL